MKFQNYVCKKGLKGSFKAVLIFAAFIISTGCNLSGKDNPGAAGGVGGGAGGGTPVDPNRPPRYRPPSYTPPPSTPPRVSPGLTNDQYFGFLWGLHNEGQTYGKVDADMDMREAWQYGTDCSNILAGVVDTGIDKNHIDLRDNIWTNPGEIPGNGIDDDNNGYVDDTFGWNFYSNNNSPMDDHGHGTHVAGTIGAMGNNRTGITGVCFKAKIAALKFLGRSGSGAVSDASEAIYYAFRNGFHVTNNSWGGGGYAQFLKDAIDQAGTNGMLFVASAGNAGRNADSTPSYPAAYSSSNIISVAATDRDDNRAYFSNYGARTVDLGAPGRDIMSTLPRDRYAYKSGTSMAAPHVTGAVALYWHLNPEKSLSEVKSHMLATVDRVSSMSGRTVSGGRLNMHNMLNPNFNALSPDGPELADGINRGSLEVSVLNNLEVNAENLSVTLVVNTAGVNLDSANMFNVGTVSAAQNANIGTFQLSFDDSVGAQTLIQMTFEVRYNGQQKDLQYESPAVDLVGTSLNLPFSLADQTVENPVED